MSNPRSADKKFFPNYNPALIVRSDIAKRYPGLEALFKPVADKLTTEKLLGPERGGQRGRQEAPRGGRGVDEVRGFIK